MKALLSRALVLCLVPISCLSGGCASASTPPPMPAWSAGSADPVPAAAPLAYDDEMRIFPRDEEKKDIWPASGLYVGAALIVSQPQGDFDGNSAMANATDLILIPDLDVGGGAGAYVSYRWYMNEFQLQYSVTEHDGSFSGSPNEHDTTFHDLDLNWRHYFLPESPLQPYGLLGFGWSRAEVDNAATLNDGPPPTFTTIEDAELKDGINVNVGAGLALYTLPWVVVYGQAMYRFVRYETSHGVGGEFDNIGNIDGDGWNLSAGAALRLLPPRK